MTSSAAAAVRSRIVIRMMTIPAISLLIVTLASTPSWASGLIQGQVTSEGSPVAGATVFVAGGGGPAGPSQVATAVSSQGGPLSLASDDGGATMTMLFARRLGDLIDRKRIFVIGLTVSAVASLLCGLAQRQELLVAARFVQGVEGAMTAAVMLGSPSLPLCAGRVRLDRRE
jgi:MFS family permease